MVSSQEGCAEGGILSSASDDDSVCVRRKLGKGFDVDVFNRYTQKKSAFTPKPHCRSHVG